MAVKIPGWTFTHWWVRPVVKVWFNIYHKSVTYSGSENIDWEKPIIFAPSHQNAFSDALCLILPARYTNNRFIYPLIRADAFGNSKAFDWLLTRFHMMPVYRPRDGVDLQQKNTSVFTGCYELLAKRRNLLVHPEGNCIPEKRVRRFKKGLARIALGAEETHNFDLGVTIIPVGINYSEITAARKGIHVRYGAPIAVSGYAEAYRTHSASAISELTRAVQDGVEQVTLNFEDKEQYRLAQELISLARSSDPDFTCTGEYGPGEFREDKVIERRLRKTGDYEALKEKTAKLSALLERYRLKTDRPLAAGHSFSALLAAGLGFLMLLPLAAYGFISNLVPWYGMHKVADMIPEKQFESSARMVSGLLLFPAAYLLQSAVVWRISGSWAWALGFLISLPVTGLITLNIWERFSCWRQRVRLRRLPEKKKREIFNLIDKITADIR